MSLLQFSHFSGHEAVSIQGGSVHPGQGQGPGVQDVLAGKMPPGEFYDIS